VPSNEPSDFGSIDFAQVSDSNALDADSDASVLEIPDAQIPGFDSSADDATSRLDMEITDAFTLFLVSDSALSDAAIRDSSVTDAGPEDAMPRCVQSVRQRVSIGVTTGYFDSGAAYAGDCSVEGQNDCENPVIAMVGFETGSLIAYELQINARNVSSMRYARQSDCSVQREACAEPAQPNSGLVARDFIDPSEAPQSLVLELLGCATSGAAEAEWSISVQDVGGAREAIDAAAADASFVDAVAPRSDAGRDSTPDDSAPDEGGCHAGFNDRDGDGTPDCRDECPDQPNLAFFDRCGGCDSALYEFCNGIDDDCDSIVDESAAVRCDWGETCEDAQCVTLTPPGFVEVLPGQFLMGSVQNELGRSADETQHLVTISRGFFLKVTEVTQREWQAQMGGNVAVELDRPVHAGVSWFEAVEYANRLSMSQGLPRCYDRNSRLSSLNCAGYRLPTEAEWEYAARAGTVTAYYSGGNSLTNVCGLEPNLDGAAWFCGNSSGRPHDVGLKAPNPWGFYDMSGNVREWAHDWYGPFVADAATDPVGPLGGDRRVLRGGSWDTTPAMTRSASRNSTSPSDRFGILGLRLARTVCVGGSDFDDDGVANCLDECPDDGLKATFGVCGCGVADEDSDNDGTPDCNDQCPDNRERVAPPCVAAPLGYVRVEPGSFDMGSPVNEFGRFDNERLHRVTLTRPFAIKVTEVTQREWQDVMGDNPSFFVACGGDCPVERVAWVDAVDFVNRLSDAQGLQRCYDGQRVFQGLDCPGYRLPTEAEWEYAARAGTTTAYHSGRNFQDNCNFDANLDAVGWYCGNAGGQTHPVASKQANTWGLFDMHGNVLELTHDWLADYPAGESVDPIGPLAGAVKVLRGGSYNDLARINRSAMRANAGIDFRLSPALGFRPARTLSR